MSNVTSKTKYLRDYQTTPYVIPHVNLHFQIISSEVVHVHSEISFKAREGRAGETITLDGENLVTHDASITNSTQGEIDLSKGLQIHNPGEEFTLKTHVEINPKTNTALSGLYVSGPNLFTQCEAEGFRRITWFYDRPDILSVYNVKITTEMKEFTQLLSNGNSTHHEVSDAGVSTWLWEDPWPKPSYLFALVAGHFGAIKELYTTSQGREVELIIYAPHEDIDRCQHAMDSLIRSMSWDEEVYGLDCDLDCYMVVATPDFNFGAMENKGLNVFNSALIYAHPSSCTDQTWQAVEATIGHEYFHNWTGNRVTCRDWFQLCLKEGLTVFRDQEFSSDMGDRDVERIKNVQLLREHQFPEDNGPMAHPPRPSEFVEINNFYTATVYEKGAEVVRMIHHLLGKENFRKGMDLYFKRHDGQAVTQEDFIKSMEDASGFGLSQFFLWYTQPGTPTVSQSETWDEAKGTWTLTLKQKVMIQGKEQEQPPRYIPVQMGLIQDSGEPARLCLKDSKPAADNSFETTLHFKEAEQSWVFSELTSKPTPSLFRGFSAPIRLESHSQSLQSYRTLLKYDKDPFVRWDCAQKIMTHTILGLANGEDLNSEVFDDFNGVLAGEVSDAQLGLIISIPSEYELSLEANDKLESVLEARKLFCKSFAQHHKNNFLSHLDRLKKTDLSSMDADAIGHRKLQHALRLLLTSIQEESILAQLQHDALHHPQMSIVQSALQCLNNWGIEQRQEATAAFYQKWQHDPLVLNSWFALEASCPSFNSADHMKELRNHKDFHLKNPNRIRSMMRSFTRQNLKGFHDASGSGYQFIADLLIDLDPINPQIAAGVARSLSHWKSLDTQRQQKVQSILGTVLERKLSDDLSEVLQTILKKA